MRLKISELIEPDVSITARIFGLPALRAWAGRMPTSSGNRRGGRL
jgi:hypothetical protein